MIKKEPAAFPQKGTSFRYKAAHIAILFFSLFWCSLFVSVPFLMEGSPFLRRVSGMITLFFSSVCHQAHDRSFHLLGHPLAVCARCSGIYEGFLLGVIIYPFFRKLGSKVLPPLSILLFGILPMVLEVILSQLGLIQSHLLYRSLTGLFLGGTVTFYVMPAVFELVHLQPRNMR